MKEAQAWKSWISGIVAGGQCVLQLVAPRFSVVAAAGTEAKAGEASVPVADTGSSVMYEVYRTPESDAGLSTADKVYEIVNAVLLSHKQRNLIMGRRRRSIIQFSPPFLGSFKCILYN